MNPTVHCYALRRLNPFLGVTQIIESEGGRALSPDGYNWEIQLYGERRSGWGSFGTTVQKRLFRYGVWSPRDGLACFPSPPLIARDEACRQAGLLVDTAAAAQDRLPFPLRDRYELWLLDATPDAFPLVLLDALSSPETPSAAARKAPRWQCATADAVDEELDPHLRTDLEQQVQRRAGQAARCTWFRREPDGQGTPLTLVRNSSQLQDRSGILQESTTAQFLAAEHFPELLVRETWADTQEQSRLHEYLSWAAPRLLMLPMQRETRARLETLATAHALCVDRFHRLYPEIDDTSLIIRLRVEAQLRQSQSASLR